MPGQPDFSGRWRANLRRCRFATPTPRSLDMLIDHFGDCLRQKVLSVTLDGVEQKALFTCPTTGEAEASQLNGDPVAARAWWRDEALMIEVTLPGPGGELRLIDCWTLSNDRSTLTMAHHDDALAGQTVTLERVAIGDGRPTS